MGEFFDSIYSRFVLRDLFSKIVPGAVALISLGLLYPRSFDVVSADLPVAIWFLLVGVAWILGLAVQQLGQSLGLIKFHQHGSDDKRYRMDRLQAHRLAKQREAQELERFLVLKEASGIGSAALGLLAVCLLIAIGVSSRWHAGGGFFAPIVIGLIAFLLARMHRQMITVEQEFIETVLEAGPPDASAVEDRGPEAT